ncbi:DUF1542 domain-containing protein [Lactobacillus johnsonii]|uniref:DUF1542 domain-containing protein n=1 Tax=Lactobacillus johnsonii TaxID=33959 RepID=A0A9X4X8T5_LACJH|nr:DUF1542 domain-containing protein [Lactobacillus johnsonii]MTE03451.1 DUF1542 domain-containing protein [Lactobacillus johnsonii]
MVSKNNIEMKNKKMRDEKQRFSIRKFSVGAASVLIGLSFSLYNGQQASADTVDNGNKSVVANAQDKEQTDNKQSTDTNPQNNEDKTNTNQTQTTVTDDLDHSTVVASYKADTPNNASEVNNSSENTESKSDEKQAVTTETAKTEEAATKEAETKNNATNDVAKKNDEAVAKTDTNADVKKTVENVKTEDTPNVDTKNNETQTVKTDEEKVEAAVDNTSSDLKNTVENANTEVSTNTFNVNEAVRNALFLSARAATKSKVATRALALAAEPEDPNAVTVTDAKGFINAIQNGTATTINVANDLNLASEYDGNYKQRVISHKRDILIQSATPGVKHTIDFSGNSFSMNTQNSVTFKDLDLYERSYWGIVYNAGGYVFDNVNFAGSQLIYTESSINSTLTFKNNVTATAVGSYTSPIDGESRSSQGGNTQQILQFVGGTNHIIFDENSNVTLGTTNSNVLEIDGGTATIDVKNGANVTINPHSKGNPENRHGIRTGSIARAIASNANTTINVDKGANLTINTEKASGDSDVAGALYLNSDATLNVNGDLNINSNGTPSTKNNGYPVYIAGNAAINVGNGGKFNLSATNTGSYSDNLMSISGKGTVKLAPHSNFKISGDGTGALTAINLSSGSTFTSDQPDSFTIDLSANTSTDKSLIKNGTINFTRVKTVTDGNESQPLGKIDVTYDRNGKATSYIITAQNENTVKQVREGLTNKNLIDLVKAGEDVTLSNLHLSKNNVLTGTVASSGSNNPIYVTVTVGGVSTNVPVLNHYTVYTTTNDTVTLNNVDYAAQTASTGGNFSIDLSKLASSLTDDAQVTVTATKDFVESAQTESVAALRALNTATLQELVDAAPDEEKKASYYNASEEAQKAYTDAISTGKDILANPNNYDQVDVDDAVTAIQKAQKALTGEPTDKTKLQAAIDQASTVESSDNYTNADADLQKAYTDAISAGQTVLSNNSATQTEVDNALTTINNAKDALNGDTKKAASKEALQKAVDEAPTVKSDDAAYYNGSAEAKTAYDNAITAGQTVLADPDATATQITDALNAINTAKSNLKGKATDKSALQTAVDNSATVKESNNYTNADQTQKTAYDNAVTAAQTVLDKTNATQSEVNQALQDLETANNNLNGDAKTEAANKAALEAAVKDAPNVRNTPAYYNGSEEAQTAYNSTINAGQAVLDQTNPSANDVKTALDAINAAKDNLKGKATNTEALETALTNANNAKETGNYTNADQANQEALNNAIIAGQEILKNTSATQAQVDSAAKAITDAISGLDGDTNLTNAKNAATEDIKKTLDTKTTEITDATNIDQATKDQLIADAKKAAEDANTAINQATDPNAVNTAKTEGITNINNVTVPSLDKAKEAANQAIDQALDTKTKEINNAENIDQTTKDKLIKAATDAANTAKDAIEKSTTNDEATKAGQAGVDAITNVKVPSVTDSQNAAKAAIDDALNAKTKEINDANNIDQTTKDQLIKEATDAANNAKEVIDKATTADAIKTAQDEGATNINNVTVPSLEDAKKAANKAVDEALTAQTEVINKADNLSDAEKKDLIDKATAEANKAKENIETATTNNEAAQAGQAGVDAIKNIVPTSLDTVKSDANKAIDDALTKKLEEISSANNLTTDEKTALTQEANTAADKAKEEITNATTNDVVIEAQNNGVSAIDGIKVPTESAVKEAAKKAVADAATAKNNAIDASNLTNEEKAALKQKVTDAQNAADQAIDNATTNAAVTEAQTNGIKAINGIEVTTSTVKEAAKKAVADAATAKNNAIDASNLTDEEKAALKQKVTDAQNAADQAIDNATTNAAVTEAQTNGVNAINGIEVPTTSATKEQAITDLNAAVDDAKKAIDQDSNLTDEEKQAAKDQIDRDATKAQEAINNAKTNDDVKKVCDAGTLAIDKDVANAAIDNAVAGKKAEISKTPLTDEEKTALNNEVDQKANTAKKAINTATSPEAVSTAQEDGIKNINDTKVPTASAAKEAAKKAVAEAAEAKNNAIDSSNLTNEEKAALKQKVTEAQTAADQAIDNATTNAGVTEAQTNGVNAINGIEVPNKSDAKEQALTDLNTAVDNAKKAIDQDSNLTDEEKQAAKDQIDSDAKNAQDAINNAKTNDDVKKAADDGTLAIDKDVANAAIDNAVAGKKAEISKSPLTDEEKTALNNEVDEKANTAKDAINNATTPEAVTTAQDNGIKNINDTEVPTESAAKEAAKKAVAEAAEAKNNAIDSSNLTDEEKAALKQEVSDAQTAANTAIDNAITNAEVTEAEDNGVKTINGIEVPTKSTTKEQATNDLNNEVENAKKAIDQDNNLTDEQKQAAKDQIESDAKKAQDAINNAKNNDDVKKAVDDGKLVIDKDVANAAIDNAVAGKKDEISKSPLTDEEKAALNNEVDQKAEEAKEAIKAATTPGAVTTAQENGIKNINDTEVPTESVAKEAAKKAVAEAADAKNKAIDSSNLTDEEKAALKQEVSDAQKAANTAIDNATTNAAVTQAQNNGIDKINSIEVSDKSAAKDQATTDLNNAVDNAKKAINQDNNLTDEQKQAAKDQIDSDAKTAQEAINNAKTNDDVKKAVDDGKLAIDKDIANAAIDNAVAGKKAEISNSPLTDEEKAALNNEVDQKAQAAKESINNATTPEAVISAQESGIKNINDTQVPAESAVKQAAKEAVAKVADEKNAAIDSSNLTDEEKAALKQEVTDAQNAANQAIDNATTDAAVTDAEENGIKAINSIEVPTKSTAKDQATTDLNNEVDEAKKTIDQDNNLTDEQKQAAKDQIDSDAKKAQEAIDNAKSNDDVKKAIDDGTLAIDKDVANAAIDNAVAGKKSEISKSPLTDEEKTALNNEVDEEAKAAKEAIKAATTSDSVTEAQDNGIKSINDIVVPTESATKEAAKKAVAEAADAKNKAIDVSSLTTEEKAALKQEVTDAQNAANTAIDNATTKAAVTEAQNNGIDKINSIEISAKSAAKEDATTDLNKEVDEAKKAIDQDNNLTDEQKQAAKDQIESDAKKAQEAIDNAKTNDDVKKAVDDGKLAIDKDVANAAIDNAVAGKLKEINDSLTNEEKQAYTDLINNEADNAKQKIAEATTPEEVTRAQEEGVKNINNINVPTTSPAKDAANAAIDQALKNKKDEINNATNISSEEKTDLIKQATEAANIAKDNINNATTNSEVETAQVDGEKAIADVTVPGLSDIKKESIDLINKALNEKQDEINNASNLSQDEKQELIDQAKKIATEAINEINNAQTNDEAKEAADTGVKNIENVSIPSIEDAKKNATQAIDDALNSKKNEINNASNLTDSEKTDLINQATEIAKAAKDAINSATTNTAVEAAEDKGVADINNIHFTNLDDSKKAANSAIEDALNTKKDEINNASNLSDSEKAKLINQATEIAKAAKDAINNATTNSAVTAAENKGIEDIANVNVPSLTETKQAAIDAIKQVQNAKNSQIEEAKNLSADEQKNLIDQVNKIAQDAINKLNDPATTTNEVITDTRDKAIDQITNLFIPTLDSVQKDAQEAINSAKEAKIDEINKADNLTDQMKQNLIDQVDQVADNATKAINNAQTNDDVKEAETKGLEDINSIQVPSLVESKDDAIKEIDDALKKKTDEINAADLDQKQKDELISQITDIATETKAKVFNATTNAEVDAEAKAGIKAIEAVKIPARIADNSNAESHNSSTNVTPDHNNEENNNAQNTNQVSTNTESESKEQTVITNSVQPKRNAVRHKNGAPVTKKATLPQTGKKDNSNLTLAGAALLGLAGVFSLFGLGDKRKKNK